MSKTLSSMGFTIRPTGDRFKWSDGVYEYYVYRGRRNAVDGKEMGFLVVDVLSVKENPRYIHFKVFENERFIGKKRIQSLAQVVVEGGEKVNYGDIELKFRDIIKEYFNFKQSS